MFLYFNTITSYIILIILVNTLVKNMATEFGRKCKHGMLIHGRIGIS